MFSIKRGILFSLISIFGVGTACAQTRPHVEQDKPKQDEPKVEVTVSASTGKEAERQLKEVERLAEPRRKFEEEHRKCRGLIKDKKSKEAEMSCKTAAQLADLLKRGSEAERMIAYESVGEALIVQKRYQESIDYYSRALVLGQSRYTEDEGVLGRLYGNVAMVNHLLGDLDKARELYRKTEKIYQTVYSRFGEGPLSEWDENYKQQYLKFLKMILGYHRNAAEEAGATSEVEEINKLIKSLP